MWAREYVESLHQNSRATLLFGKNNVLVQPVQHFAPCDIKSLYLIKNGNMNYDFMLVLIYNLIMKTVFQLDIV